MVLMVTATSCAYRLCRFTYDLLQFVLQHCGVEIVIETPDGDQDLEKDLADDILSVFKTFGAQMYAMGANRKKPVGGNANPSVEAPFLTASSSSSSPTTNELQSTAPLSILPPPASPEHTTTPEETNPLNDPTNGSLLIAGKSTKRKRKPSVNTRKKMVGAIPEPEPSVLPPASQPLAVV